MKKFFLFILIYQLTKVVVLAQMPSNDVTGSLNGANISTGVVPVSVPIYTLSDGGISLPINLNYDASGVKADDIASCVGLKWNLDAGGKIIRIIKDKPDESFLGLDSDGWDICMTNRHFWGYKRNDLTYNYPNWTAFDGKYYFLRDLEPDIFTLNLHGENIPFVISSGGVEKNGVRIILLNENKDIFIEYLENEYNYLQTPAEPNPNYSNTLDQLIHDYPKRLRERQCSSTTPFDKFLPNSAFKVTDSDGTVYYFGLDVSSREYSFSLSTLDDSNYLSVQGHPEKKEKHTLAGTMVVSPTTWMLSKITKPKGTIQPFNKYKLEDKFQEVNFNYTRSLHIAEVWEFSQQYKEQIDACVSITPVATTLNESPLYYQAQLSSIESDNFIVKFNASEIFAIESKIPNLSNLIPDYKVGDFSNIKRLDLEGTSDNSAVKSSVQQSQGIFSNTITNPIKNIPTSTILRNILITDKATGKKLGFYLDYSYFINQNDNRQISVFSLGQDFRINKRLMLKGVYPIEIGTLTSKLLNGYVFNYNSVSLPARLTWAVDHWGYFNGKYSNNQALSYLPRAPLRNLATLAVTSTCASTADFEPDANFAQAGVLKQITYPLGGNIKYEYELHDSDNYYTSKSSTGIKNGLKAIGGLRIKRIITYDPVANKEYITKYSYKKSSIPSESSGFLSIWPNYDFTLLKRVPTTQTYTGISFTDPTDINYKFIPDKSYISLSHTSELQSRFINGNYITYREVKVEQTTLVNAVEISNGYSLYEYNINENQPYVILKSNGQLDFDVTNPTVYGNCFSRYRFINNLATSATQTNFDWNTPKYDFTKGSLKKISIYKNGLLTPISTTEYQYNVNDLTNTYNVKSAFAILPSLINVSIGGSSYQGQKVVRIASGISNVAGYFFSPAKYISMILSIINYSILISQNSIDNSTYNIQKYNLPIAKINYNKVITTNYDLSGNMPVQSTTTYSYGTAHNQPTNIVTITKNSDTAYPSSTSQEKTEQVIKYVRDYGATVNNTFQCSSVGILNMTNRRFNVPVETIAKKNDLVIGGSIKDFQCDLNLVGLEKTIYGLELANPLTSFTLSTLSNGVVSKHANYAPIVNYTEYNTKGLVTKFNREKAPVTQINYGYNNLLPSSIIVASDVPAISKTVSYEYDSPLFGLRKATAPDGTFTSTEYDNLGRVKAIRDLNGNLLKSYGYNFIAKTFANISSNIILQKKSGTSFIDVKTLVDNDTYQAVTGEFLNIKVTTTSTIKSIVVTFDNKFVWKSNYINNSNVFTLFGTTGFDPSVLVNSAQKIGSCNVKVQLYSDVDGQGDLIGYKNIKFNLY